MPWTEPFSGSPSNPSPPTVAVVGGGITGLAAAYAFLPAVREGHLQVTLMEQEERLGGKVRTLREEGFTLEAGPDSFLTRKPHARQLCLELGLGEELTSTPTLHRKSFFLLGEELVPPPRGLVWGVPTNLVALRKTPLLSRAGKARALADLVLPRVLHPGEDAAVGEFLAQRLGREVVVRLAEPLLAGVYAGSAFHLSLDAVAPVLRQAEEQRRSLIQGLRGPSPSSPPPADATPPFETLRGGLESLPHALERRLRQAGVRISLGVQGTVVSLHRDQEGTFHLSTAAGETVQAQGVVIATPAGVAARLVRPLAPQASMELTAIPYASVALVGLGYTLGEGTSLPQGSGFVVPRDQGTPATALTILSQKWPHSAPPGQLLVRVYLGRGGEEASILDWDDEVLVRMAEDLVKRSLRLMHAPVYRQVIRLPHALPQYVVGHVPRTARLLRAMQDVPGLELAGSYMDGVGLSDCIRQGEEAAHRLQAWLAQAPSSPRPRAKGRSGNA
jgi:oxygen-dependent protoporphyrinogen oxidase